MDLFSNRIFPHHNPDNPPGEWPSLGQSSQSYENLRLAASLDARKLFDGRTTNGQEAQVIFGKGGQEKIQLRLGLSYLQMLPEGRPDGTSVHGFESALAYCRHERVVFQARNPGKAFLLDTEAMNELLREARQYLSRALAYASLEDFLREDRDIKNMAAIYQFIWQHSPNPDPLPRLDELSMLTYSQASRLAQAAMKHGCYEFAEKSLQAAIQTLQNISETARENSSYSGGIEELHRRWETTLLECRGHLLEQMPHDALPLLRLELEDAEHSQDYERASYLKGQIESKEIKERAAGNLGEPGFLKRYDVLANCGSDSWQPALDLETILAGWNFEPGQISAREIAGINGELCFQMRTDLGLLQMCKDGHPAWRNFQSMLEYHHQRKRQYTAVMQGHETEFQLTQRECQDLRLEAYQYYQRFLCAFILDEWKAAVNDAQHCIDTLDLIALYGGTEQQYLQDKSMHAYFTMMSGRARAYMLKEQGRPDTALQEIALTIKSLQDMEENGRVVLGGEVETLSRCADQIIDGMPEDAPARLGRELKRAVEAENYERAAWLRDALKAI